MFISDIEGGDDKRKRTARKLNIGNFFIYNLLKQLNCI